MVSLIGQQILAPRGTDPVRVAGKGEEVGVEIDVVEVQRTTGRVAVTLIGAHIPARQHGRVDDDNDA